MKNLIVLSFALFFNTGLLAQEFYLLNNDNQIYSYNYNNGVSTFLTNLNMPDDQLLDIAYADENHLYAVTGTALIINIDITTGDFDVVFDFQNSHNYNGLVYNTDNNLVAIDSQAGAIITFSLDTNTVVSEFVIGTGNPGDLTYYQGNLLFQGMNSTDIFAFDGSALKSVACAAIVGYWGMSNFTTDCNTNLFLAFDGNGNVYEYDIEGQTYEQTDNLFGEVGGIYGSTTVNEQFAYDCTLVDLEEIICVEPIVGDYFMCEYNTATQINSILVFDQVSSNLNTVFEMDLPGAILWDIAFSDLGGLYGLTDTQQIIKIEEDASFTIVAQLENTSGYESMVGNSSHELILVGSLESKILTFSLDTNTIISETSIPEGSPGDATYYRGNLIYQGVEGYDFYAFDGTTAKTFACNDTSPIRAMANVFTSCLNNDVIAVREDGVFYWFDVQAGSLTYITGHTAEVGIIYGATTRTEFMASACDFLNLEELDCKLSTPSEELASLVLYPNPVTTKLWIRSKYSLEALRYEIYSVQGQKIMEGTYQNGIDFNEVAAGVYFVKLREVDSKVFVFRSLIKK